MQILTLEEMIKKNMLALAKQHKEQCNKEDCNISLSWMLALFHKANIYLTEEEKKVLM